MFNTHGCTVNLFIRVAILPPSSQLDKQLKTLSSLGLFTLLGMLFPLVGKLWLWLLTHLLPLLFPSIACNARAVGAPSILTNPSQVWPSKGRGLLDWEFFAIRSCCFALIYIRFLKKHFLRVREDSNPRYPCRYAGMKIEYNGADSLLKTTISLKSFPKPYVQLSAHTAFREPCIDRFLLHCFYNLFLFEIQW